MSEGPAPGPRWPVPVPPTRLCPERGRPCQAPRGDRVPIPQRAVTHGATSPARAASRTSRGVPTSSTPASCWPTRPPSADSPSTGWSLPVVVITELEAKRHHPELGYFARQALRDARRPAHRARPAGRRPSGRRPRAAASGSSSTTPTRRCCRPGSGWGTTTPGSCPWPRSLASEGDDVVLVSKDLPLRVKAAAVGLTAQEYRAELPPDSGWTGMAELDVTAGRHGRALRHGQAGPRGRRASCPATPAWC